MEVPAFPFESLLTVMSNITLNNLIKEFVKAVFYLF